MSYSRGKINNLGLIVLPDDETAPDTLMLKLVYSESTAEMI